MLSQRGSKRVVYKSFYACQRAWVNFVLLITSSPAVGVAFHQLVTGQSMSVAMLLNLRVRDTSSGYFELGVTVTPSHFISKNT